MTGGAHLTAPTHANRLWITMLNRWFHKAKLHTPDDHSERKVGWLELFYDLVYVATFIQLGNALLFLNCER